MSAPNLNPNAAEADGRDFVQWMRCAQAQTELILARALPARDAAPAYLHDAMRYAVLDGGKRLRPLLVFAAAELGGAEEATVEAAAAAIEMIHVYSLVHDDMPEMDNDDLRRGKPTVHKAYNQATALLVGDVLQTQAFLTLSTPLNLPAPRQLAMLRTLAAASGSLGMGGGQAIDLHNVGRSMTQAELEQMHAMKTGALIRAAVALGALACPDLEDTALQQLDDYAAKIGLAFQVVDDILDCCADTATLGKTAGKDADNDKPTFVQLMGLEGAQAYADRLVAQADAALTPFGSQAQRLRELAAYVVAREY